MKDYSLKSLLSNVYATFPATTHRPLIGITANFTDGDASLRDRYYQQVVDGGGVPVLIPPVNDPQVILNTLEHIDGLLLSGGADYNPLWCGEEPSRNLMLSVMRQSFLSPDWHSTDRYRCLEYAVEYRPWQWLSAVRLNRIYMRKEQR